MDEKASETMMYHFGSWLKSWAHFILQQPVTGLPALPENKLKAGSASFLAETNQEEIPTHWQAMIPDNKPPAHWVAMLREHGMDWPGDEAEKVASNQETWQLDGRPMILDNPQTWFPLFQEGLSHYLEQIGLSDLLFQDERMQLPSVSRPNRQNQITSADTPQTSHSSERFRDSVQETRIAQSQAEIGVSSVKAADTLSENIDDASILTLTRSQTLTAGKRELASGDKVVAEDGAFLVGHPREVTQQDAQELLSVPNLTSRKWTESANEGFPAESKKSSDTPAVLSFQPSTTKEQPAPDPSAKESPSHPSHSPETGLELPLREEEEVMDIPAKGSFVETNASEASLQVDKPTDSNQTDELRLPAQSNLPSSQPARIPVKRRVTQVTLPTFPVKKGPSRNTASAIPIEPQRGTEPIQTQKQPPIFSDDKPRVPSASSESMPEPGSAQPKMVERLLTAQPPVRPDQQDAGSMQKSFVLKPTVEKNVQLTTDLPDSLIPPTVPMSSSHPLADVPAPNPVLGQQSAQDAESGHTTVPPIKNSVEQYPLPPQFVGRNAAVKWDEVQQTPFPEPANPSESNRGERTGANLAPQLPSPADGSSLSTQGVRFNWPSLPDSPPTINPGRGRRQDTVRRERLDREQRGK